MENVVKSTLNVRQSMLKVRLTSCWDGLKAEDIGDYTYYYHSRYTYYLQPLHVLFTAVTRIIIACWDGLESEDVEDFHASISLQLDGRAE